MRHWKHIYNTTHIYHIGAAEKYSYSLEKSANYFGIKGDKIVEDIIDEVKYQLRVCNIYIKPNIGIDSYNIEDEIRKELQSKAISIRHLQLILDYLKGKKDKLNGKTEITYPLDTFLTYNKKRKNVSNKKKKTKEPEIITKKVHEKDDEPEGLEMIIEKTKEKAEKKEEVCEEKIEPNTKENKDIGKDNTESKDSEKDNTTNKLFGQSKKGSKNEEAGKKINLDITNLTKNLIKNLI